MNKSSDYKRVFDHFDEDGNGSISPSELHRCVGLIHGDEIMNKSSDYKRVFDHFDEDGNGTISPSELHRCVGLIHRDEILTEDLQIAIESLYGNGELGFADFVRLVESDEEEEKVEDLRKAFRMYEMDGTGCITPASLKMMLNRLGESMSEDECVGMISEFDLNGDGVLSFDEFRAMMV